MPHQMPETPENIEVLGHRYIHVHVAFIFTIDLSNFSIWFTFLFHLKGAPLHSHFGHIVKENKDYLDLGAAVS